MFRGRVRKPTYEKREEELLNPKLIVLNRHIKTPLLLYIMQNTNDVDFDDFDLSNHNLKTMLNKTTQKDHDLQNHDVFPSMYHEIGATGSDMGNNEMRKQTKKYIPKDYDYSSSHSNKPSSPPSPHHISRPVSSTRSEQKALKKKGYVFFNSRDV